MAEAHILYSSVDELLRLVEQHRRLLRGTMEGREVPITTCLHLDCPHRRKLRATLAETIEVLDETRSAFKSKQLEVLRKKLIGVLAESA